MPLIWHQGCSALSCRHMNTGQVFTTCLCTAMHAGTCTDHPLLRRASSEQDHPLLQDSPHFEAAPAFRHRPYIVAGI